MYEYVFVIYLCFLLQTSNYNYISNITSDKNWKNIDSAKESM